MFFTEYKQIKIFGILVNRFRPKKCLAEHYRLDILRISLNNPATTQRAKFNPFHCIQHLRLFTRKFNKNIFVKTSSPIQIKV